MSVFTRTVKNNIWKLNAINVLRWFMLAIPIIVLFYQDNGLSMTQIFILQAVWSVIIVFLEIPTGFFADRVGRRLSIIIGSLIGFVGYLIYSLSYGFTGFLIAEITLGIAGSLFSGADSALLYDSLEELGKKGEYKKYEGRYSSFGNFSEGTAAVIGGFLALISLRTPIYWEAVALFWTIPVAFTLKETTRQVMDISQGRLKKIIEISKFALHDHKEIKWLIIYSGIISCSTITMVWFIQPYFVLVGLPLVWFGVVWAALNVSTGIFSYIAHTIENFWGRKKSLISLMMLTVAAYWFLAAWQAWWGIAIIFIFYFVRGINTPVLLDYVNRLIPSDTRATILSVKSFVARLIFAIFGPLIGWATDVYSLSAALMMSGITFLVLGSISIFFLHRHKAL